ncbi:MAG: carboxypeptidase-like regulatory domain-containing protein [Bacteroidales bacterium]|nr:carboxypeptidase-like regulatory domain-containing protein [Bacteroidales bacterium]
MTKSFVKYLVGALLLLSVFPAVGRNYQDRYELTVSGTVVDRDGGRRLENVTVSLVGTSIGTVTNADGYFSLKIPHQDDVPVLEFSHLGYVNTRLHATSDVVAGNVRIRMAASVQELDESFSYGDARLIVNEALHRIPQNYADSEDVLNAFYRETVQKGHRYISISEAVMDIYKTPYTRRKAAQDLARIDRARRLLSQKASDTLGVKVLDGPILALNMDIVKNEDALFDETNLGYYNFSREPSVWINDRIQYVVRFEPRVTVSYALMVGRLYIDCETLAITRAEFALDMSDRDKATDMLIVRRPAGLRFIPQEFSIVINYREQDGRMRLSYLCCQIRFKCDWKKRFFSSAYTARCEMVMVEREQNPGRIAAREAYRRGQAFYDMVDEYWDEDFWRDYNIIEPTESLESAVRRLRK